jgi:tungstate transport system substrate-binding protein
MFTRRSLLINGILVVGLGTLPAQAQERSIIVASTTSTEDSGLFGHILPLFKAKSGVEVHVVAQGTGQALVQDAAGMLT